MAWTAPRTWTTGEIVTAALLNTHLRDNLLETAPAKVTTAEDMIVGAGANNLKRVAVGSNGQIWGVSAGVVGWVSGGASGAAGGALAGTYPNPTLATLAQHLLFVDNTYDIGASGATRPRHLYLAGNAVVGGTLGAGNTVVGTLQCNGITSFGDINSLGTTFPGTDNIHSCGKSSGRWTAVWAVNGTIQTSTRESKNVRGRVEPAAALAAALATPLYSFTYKGDDPDLADRPQVGFLADEADPLLCPDGASASPNTTASVALAAIQALAAEVASLKAQIAALTTPPAAPAPGGA